jgi:hypothetical protein
MTGHEFDNEPDPKPQVQMPKSTDEKKLEPPKVASQAAKEETIQQGQQTQQVAAQGQQQASSKPEEISGEIEKVSLGKGGQEGSLWLVVNKKIICIPANLVDAEMVAGAKVLVSAYRKANKNGETFMASEVVMLVPPVQEGEIIDAEYADVEPSGEKGPDSVLEEARAAGLGGIFDDAPAKAKVEAAPAAQTASVDEATKPGTAGIKRARRLHTLITQNHRNTLFTEDLLKKYLATQRLEHARDLSCPPKDSGAFNAYEYACSMAVGEVDWHEVLDD